VTGPVLLWSVRARQVPAVARGLPKVANGGPVVATAIAALVLVALTGQGAGVLIRLRWGAALVAAAGAFVLEDGAAVTVASSPTPLVVRRLHRVVALVAIVAVWWTAALMVAHRRADGIADGALTRELAVLLVLGLLGATAAAWRRPDTPGGLVGATLALGWYGASWLPRIGHVPLPPPALDPAAASRLSAVLVAGAAALLLLSRDPAAGSPVSPGRSRRSASGCW
jgi:hypothetical protein